MSASGVLERSADVTGAVNAGDDGDGGGSRKVVLWVIALVLVRRTPADPAALEAALDSDDVDRQEAL